MRKFPVVKESELRLLAEQGIAHLKTIKKHTKGLPAPSDVEDYLQRLASLDLISISQDSPDVDVGDDVLRMLASSQQVPYEQMATTRQYMRDIFYQVFCEFKILCVGSAKAMDEARRVTHALRHHTEWACAKAGYQLMYADNGARAAEAEDVFRPMVDKSPLIAFFCSEIHSNGLIRSESTKEKVFDYNEALYLLGKNLQPQFAESHTLHYIRSANRYAEIVIQQNMGVKHFNFITEVLMKIKTLIEVRGVRVGEVDSKKFMFVMTSVMLMQIQDVSKYVVNEAIASKRLNTYSAEVFKSQLSTQSSTLLDLVSTISSN